MAATPTSKMSQKLAEERIKVLLSARDQTSKHAYILLENYLEVSKLRS